MGLNGRKEVGLNGRTGERRIEARDFIREDSRWVETAGEQGDELQTSRLGFPASAQHRTYEQRPAQYVNERERVMDAVQLCLDHPVLLASMFVLSLATS
ncbi:uncharacterized [Tachysurus ichikawai]